MISAGDNTIRVAGLRRGRETIYDIYQFNVVNLKGEVHGFCYKVPAGTQPGGLVKDLLALHRAKLWFTVYLKEKNGLLSIFTIKEPKRPQNELWSEAQKVIPQTARTLRELVN